MLLSWLKLLESFQFLRNVKASTCCICIVSTMQYLCWHFYHTYNIQYHKYCKFYAVFSIFSHDDPVLIVIEVNSCCGVKWSPHIAMRWEAQVWLLGGLSLYSRTWYNCGESAAFPSAYASDKTFTSFQITTLSHRPLNPLHLLSWDNLPMDGWESWINV